MRIKPILLAVTAACAVAACEPVETLPEPTPTEDACGAAAFQGLIGQPRTVLNQMNFPINTRQIGPNDAVTADFRPDRLNIEYGENGRIQKVSCY